MFIISCESSQETTNPDRPLPIQSAHFESFKGGCIVYFELPSDESIHHVKAVYKLESGKEITRAVSYFSDSIIIDGFHNSDNYDLKLYTVNYLNIESNPYILKIKPDKSPLDDIVNSVKIIPSFSSVQVSWTNETGIWLQIFVEVSNQDDKLIITEYNMDEGNNSFYINNLYKTPYNFTVYIHDRYGNATDTVDLGMIEPLEDSVITKSNWSIIPDSNLPDSMFNADLIFQEGRIYHFWDDIIDNANDQNLNFFYSSIGFPFSYYIDLNQSIKLSRFKIWQREFRGADISYQYKGQNVKSFELWISNDKLNWEKLGVYTISKPSNPETAVKEAKDGHEFFVYDIPQFSPEFRYLRFKGLESFGMEDQYACLSEITLYGSKF